MNNHGLANTCKVHAHASCWDVAHLLPDTGTIGSILAPVGVCCDTRQRRVFVSSICPSGVLLPYGVAFLLQSRLTTQLWLEQHWRRVSSVASCFIGRMDTRSSHQSPTRDDSQDTGKCSLLHDVDASRLRSLGSSRHVHPRLPHCEFCLLGYRLQRAIGLRCLVSPNSTRTVKWTKSVPVILKSDFAVPRT
ncbi:hypothetical protein EV401DRAFT_4975 [Pisolithus croceorrhizus]|nr:hypothetical protein EV401DRAFT_4975 [Pisolithus croceorrhizus]